MVERQCQQKRYLVEQHWFKKYITDSEQKQQKPAWENYADCLISIFFEKWYIYYCNGKKTDKLVSYR